MFRILFFVFMVLLQLNLNAEVKQVHPMLSKKTEFSEEERKKIQQAIDKGVRAYLECWEGKRKDLRSNTVGMACLNSVFGLSLTMNAQWQKQDHVALWRHCVNGVHKFPLIPSNKRFKGPGTAVTVDKVQTNVANWAYAMITMFWAQITINSEDYYGYYDHLEKLVNLLIEMQYPSGGWTHGGHEFVHDLYYEMVAISVVVMNALGMANQAGMDIPNEVKEKAMAYMKSCSFDGKLGYDTRIGYVEIGECNRSSAAYAGLIRMGFDENDTYLQTIKPDVKMMEKCGGSHSGPSLSYLFSGITAKHIGGEVWKKYKEKTYPLLLDLQNEDGTFKSLPKTGKDKHAAQLGKYWDTAVACYILSSFLEDTPSSITTDLTRVKQKKCSHVMRELAAFLKRFQGKNRQPSFDGYTELIGQLVKKEGVKESDFEDRLKDALVVLKELKNVDEKKYKIILSDLASLRWDVTPYRNKKGQLTHLVVECQPLKQGTAEGVVEFVADNEKDVSKVKPLKVTLNTKKKWSKKQSIRIKNKKMKRLKGELTFRAKWMGCDLEFVKKIDYQLLEETKK